LSGAVYAGSPIRAGSGEKRGGTLGALSSVRAAIRAEEEAVMFEAWKMGGFGMFPTAIFGVLLVASAIRYALSPERRYVPLQLSLGVMTLSAGGLGFVTGMIKSALAIEGAGAERRWVWILGMGESLANVALALALVTLAALAASVGALRIAREPGARALAA
jgi:hypothetical protein